MGNGAWSIWRNLKVWGAIEKTVDTIVHKSFHVLQKWLKVMDKECIVDPKLSIRAVACWEKPSRDVIKFNVDASFSNEHNKVGIGIFALEMSLVFTWEPKYYGSKFCFSFVLGRCLVCYRAESGHVSFNLETQFLVGFKDRG